MLKQRTYDAAGFEAVLEELSKRNGQPVDLEFSEPRQAHRTRFEFYCWRRQVQLLNPGFASNVAVLLLNETTLRFTQGSSAALREAMARVGVSVVREPQVLKRTSALPIVQEPEPDPMSEILKQFKEPETDVISS